MWFLRRKSEQKREFLGENEPEPLLSIPHCGTEPPVSQRLAGFATETS